MEQLGKWLAPCTGAVSCAIRYPFAERGVENISQPISIGQPGQYTVEARPLLRRKLPLFVWSSGI